MADHEMQQLEKRSELKSKLDDGTENHKCHRLAQARMVCVLEGTLRSGKCRADWSQKG